MSFLYRPYPTIPKAPAWGPQSSKSNFCEEDYIITSCVGEFVNTVTNLNYVIYGINGLRRTRERPDGSLFSFLAFPYWGLVSVGVLSGYFHATLKYHSQMGDDLSMFVATGAVLNQVYTFDRSPSQGRSITLLILGLLIPISIYHCWADEVVVHQITFGSMVFLVGRKTRHLIRDKVKSREDRRRLRRLAKVGISSAVLGYLLWNIDVHLCPPLTAFKHSLGLPWGMLFELHGWWHILTGIGAYAFMALVEYLVTLEDDNSAQLSKGSIGFTWPAKSIMESMGKNGEEKGE